MANIFDNMLDTLEELDKEFDLYTKKHPKKQQPQQSRAPEHHKIFIKLYLKTKAIEKNTPS